jgi:hypothetical protein
VSATVVWEDAKRPARSIFFEAPEPFAADLTADPHAFLLAAAIPALRAGEARVRVASRLCPRLCDGLLTAMRRLSDWFAPGRSLPRIEAAAGFEPARPARSRRALFLSGGVDSLALLHGDRLARPASHSDAFRDAFFVDGFDIFWSGGQEGRGFYERALASLAPVAVDAAIELVPVRTNLRILDEDAWLDEALAAGTASVAHAFSRRIDRVSIAASVQVDDLVPIGTHPEIDPLYSSAGLAIRHDGVEQRRIEKIARVAEWKAGLQALRVCWAKIHPDGPLNCGRCHKCVLTMLELVAVGGLDACPTFEADDVSPAMMNKLRVTTPSSFGFFRELVAPLRARGRDDLAAALVHKVAVHEEVQRWRHAPAWWKLVRRGSDRRLERWAQRRARVDATGAPSPT